MSHETSQNNYEILGTAIREVTTAHADKAVDAALHLALTDFDVLSNQAELSDENFQHLTDAVHEHGTDVTFAAIDMARAMSDRETEEAAKTAKLHNTETMLSRADRLGIEGRDSSLVTDLKRREAVLKNGLVNTQIKEHRAIVKIKQDLHRDIQDKLLDDPFEFWRYEAPIQQSRGEVAVPPRRAESEEPAEPAKPEVITSVPSPETETQAPKPGKPDLYGRIVDLPWHDEPEVVAEPGESPATDDSEAEVPKINTSDDVPPAEQPNPWIVDLDTEEPVAVAETPRQPEKPVGEPSPEEPQPAVRKGRMGRIAAWTGMGAVRALRADSRAQTVAEDDTEASERDQDAPRVIEIDQPAPQQAEEAEQYVDEDPETIAMNAVFEIQHRFRGAVNDPTELQAFMRHNDEVEGSGDYEVLRAQALSVVDQLPLEEQKAIENMLQSFEDQATDILAEDEAEKRLRAAARA